jgi:GDPmannose 4,6-dehydratase
MTDGQYSSKKNIALITGILGQDARYCAEYLNNLGYGIVGTTRSIKNIDHAWCLRNGVLLEEWDCLNSEILVSIIQKYNPSEIYNFAAMTIGGSALFNNPLHMLDVNGLTAVRILESIKECDCRIKFCQASSSEMYASNAPAPQNESSEFRSRSPYAAAKFLAHSMVGIYREKYNIFACSAILFNHESPHRPLNFVSRKITRGAARIKLGLDRELVLGNLESVRDWSYAGDFVRAMWMMLQADISDDYVVASGEAHTIRDFCNVAFSYLDLDYRDFVRTSQEFSRPIDTNYVVGDNSKLRSLGWAPEISFSDLVESMVENDMNMLLNNADLN